MADKIFDVKGQVILIVGASTGIGVHFAKVFGSLGATVVVTARREGLLKEVVADIEAAGGKASFVTMDVMNRESVKAGVADTLKRYGKIDTLVNSAGILVDGKSAQNHTEEDFTNVLGTNLTGCWRASVEVANQWMLKNGGNIVMVGSVLGERQVKGSAAYLAAKAGLHQLTKTLALEWAGRNVRVNAILPGYCLTDLTTGLFEKPDPTKKVGERELSDLGAKFVQGIPMKKFVLLDDLVGPMLLLTSGASSRMTGTFITVDAGHLVSSL
mmetsp:Transcript_130499/g.226760  ORF Transcript_130499/g.226760 Transcript_130499/m.226760 type:complete len:270 (+) Transcript_130499:36-845(+)